MLALAAPLVKWDDILKILLAGLIGAVGVVVVYGFGLLAVSRARSTKSEGVRVADYGIAGVCGLLCVAAVAIGIYAMVNKPKSSTLKSPPKTHVALILPARGGSLVA